MRCEMRLSRVRDQFPFSGIAVRPFRSIGNQHFDCRVSFNGKRVESVCPMRLCGASVYPPILVIFSASVAVPQIPYTLACSPHSQQQPLVRPTTRGATGDGIILDEQAAQIPADVRALEKSSMGIQSLPAPASPLDDARQLYWNGDYHRAAALYSEIIIAGTDVAAAYAGLARVYLAMHQVDNAYKAAAKAIELEPSLPAAQTALGEVYLQQGKLYEAEQEFLRPQTAKREDARAYFGLSLIYHATFNERRAKTVLDRARILDPKDPEINSAWLQTRPAGEQIRALEAVVASRGHGDHVARARARQMLAVLKDQAQHPDRSCQVVSRVQATQMNLQPLFPMTVGKASGDQAPRLGDPFYPLTPNGQGGLDAGVGLDARLNRYKVRLVVETSGNRITLNQKVAEKAGAQKIVPAEIVGPGDENPPEGFTAYVESIEIGEVELKGCYVTVIEEASPRNSLANFAGAIGVGIFSNFLVDLDLRQSKLKLSQLPPYPEGTLKNPAQEGKETGSEAFHDRYIAAEMADWVPVYRSGQLLLLSTYVNASAAKLFAISAGSTVSAISQEAAQEVSTVTTDQFTRLRGVNGQVRRARRTGPVKLQFAGVEVDANALAVVDMSIYSENGIGVAGLLGFPALRYFDVKIDYRDGLLYFDNK